MPSAAFSSVLLQVGFTRRYVTIPPRGLLHHGSTLACAYQTPSAVHFCGTFLQLALTGRYPALCPAEPGLSSRAPAGAPAIVCQTFRDCFIVYRTIETSASIVCCQLWPGKSNPGRFFPKIGHTAAARPICPHEARHYTSLNVSVSTVEAIARVLIFCSAKR